MQKTLDKKMLTGTSDLVKVIEVRTSYKLHDHLDIETMPLVTWVVVVHDVFDRVKEVHSYDKPIKAQRKFDRLTK